MEGEQPWVDQKKRRWPGGGRVGRRVEMCRQGFDERPTPRRIG